MNLAYDFTDIASNRRHEMTPGGLSASLPGRLTESTVMSEDRIWPGLDSVGGARSAVPLVGGGVHLHDLVLGL